MQHAFNQSAVERANFHHFIMDIAWFGVALAASSRFMQIYAIRMGATPMEIGWLTSLPAIVLLFANGLSGWWRRRFDNSTQAILLPSLGFRFIFLLPALAPFFPAELRPLWLIAAVTLPALPQGIAASVFVLMLREAVSEKDLTRLLARRTVWMNITTGAGALAFGGLLMLVPFPYNYQIMFLVSFIFAMVSQWHVLKVQALTPVETPDTAQPPIRIWRSREFLGVAFVLLVTYIGFYSVFAVTPLHLQHTLGAEEGFMALYGVVELLAGVLAAAYSNLLIQRLGTRNVTAIGMLIIGVGTLLLAVAPNLWITLIPAALIWGAWTMVTIGVFGYFAQRTPAHDIRYNIAFHQVVFLATFIGPMLGSALAEHGVSLIIVMLLGGLARFGAGALLQEHWFGLAARRRVPQQVPEGAGD